MAITPRTIFTNPASAALTAASLFAVTAAGMYAFTTCPSSCSFEEAEPAVSVHHKMSTCTAQHAPTGTAALSEESWFDYANCYSEQGNSPRVVEITTQGLRHYPASEALYNLKGYHQIVTKQYHQAVQTLETGMRRVGAPSNGLMANNLAWAGLWAPRSMTRDRARQLYTLALRYEPTSCETLHTGLWVEYAKAKETTGIQRAEALRNFNMLKHRYGACTDRYLSGDWNALTEVLGAAVVMEDVEREFARNTRSIVRGCDSKKGSLLKNVSKELRKRYRGSTIDSLCMESIPLSSAHHTCINLIDKTITDLRKDRVVVTF